MLLVLCGSYCYFRSLAGLCQRIDKRTYCASQCWSLERCSRGAVVPGFDNDPIAEKKAQEVNGVEYSYIPPPKEGKFIGAAVEAAAMGFGGERKSWSVSMLRAGIIDYILCRT